MISRAQRLLFIYRLLAATTVALGITFVFTFEAAAAFGGAVAFAGARIVGHRYLTLGPDDLEYGHQEVQQT